MRMAGPWTDARRVMPRLSASGPRRPSESSRPVAGGSSCISRERPSRLSAALSRAGSVACYAAGFLVAVAALLALPLQGQAQTTLVSNTGQVETSNWTVGGSDHYVHAQGDSLRATTRMGTRCFRSKSVSELVLAVDEVMVSIYGADASGNPESSLYELTNPSSIVASGLNTFTAPTRPTLEKETEYFIVVEATTGSFFVSSTITDAEDDGAASGWSINDDRHRFSSGSWSLINSELPIAVKGTIDEPTTVTIAAEHESIGAGLEDLKFTLTRVGDTTEELVATVTIDQDRSWLGNSDLSHTVTFLAGEATATLTIAADRFSFDPSTKGDLTATVSVGGISGGEDTVEIVSTPEPPITISYDMSSYTFEEDADDEAIYAVATLHTAYPRPPANFFFSFSSREGTAGSPEDYNAISWFPEFMGSEFVRDIDTDPFVASKTVPFLLVNDDVYEGSEQFEMIMEQVPGLRTGLVQSAHPNGATCEANTCTSFPRYPVTVTDEEDRPELSLSAAPALIAEEDDSGTAGIEENVSTLTAGITNGKTFWTDRTVTLDFGGTAVEGTDYSVSPADADPVAAGHQVVLQGGESLVLFYDFDDEEGEYDEAEDGQFPGASSVEVTVTAMANAAVDVNRTVEVSGDLDGTDIGSTLITILPAGTTAVTIAAEHESIGAGLEDLKFTLTRVGDATEELVATVTIDQDESWLGNSDLSHTVTFPAGEATATLTIAADRFSFDPSIKGDLTATVSGDGISGGEDTVEIVSTPEPPITISYDMSSYAFEEDADDEAIYAVATLHTAYPRPPASFFVSFSSRAGTAGSPEDYNAISWFPEFMASEFVRDIVTGPLVARKRVQGEDRDSEVDFQVVNDDVYEGSEQFELIIERVAGLRPGLLQFAHPNGTTCEGAGCAPAYPVTITDEEDRPELSLSAAPALIAEEDDSGTAGIEENVSTLTAGITNGKTFWTDRTVTLDFGGTAVEGTDYSVNPADADPVAAGHQVVLQGGASLLPFYDFEDEEDEDDYDDYKDGEYPGKSSVEVTVTAMANPDADVNRTVEVSGELDGTDIGSTLITIVPNTFPLASNSTVTTEENTGYTFSAGDFNFTDADAGDELASVTVVTLPAAGVLALDGAAVTAGEAVAVEDIGKLVFTPAANANGDAYTSFTFRVSDGTAESVDTYTMTVNVTPVNDAPTGASNTVTTDEDTDYTFSAGDFNFSDADAGDELASVTVVTLPAAGELALDGAAVVAGREVQAADIGKLVFTPAANANGDAYTSFTFKVSDGTAESVDTYIMTIDVTAVDDPATGAPTIGGMAWPGGTLTANTSSVDDADGMTGATLAYEWTRLDPEGVSNPVQVGTDSPTYAPVAADIGSNIGVTVSFTDDGNNDEALTSAAVGPVVAEPLTVTIAANHDSIGAGVEDLVFTLTRMGSTAEELDATVTIAQHQVWLDDSDLSHTVTFLSGEPTATLTLTARSFSLDPDTSGDLTATVSGIGISGDSETVKIVSTPEPPITVSYDKSAYTFAEDGVDAAIYAVLTLHPAYPRAPPNFVFVSFSSRSGTAESPDDYQTISWIPTFIENDFVHDADSDPHVARKPVPGFHIVNDVVYEGSEHFTMIIEQAPGLRSGLVQVALPNGNTCDLGSCSPTPHFPVEITDEEDLPALSLWASPESIDEEDDSATQDAENVSTVTVQIINGTTLPADRTVTLRFTGGTAIENSHFTVSPPDADPNATGHQVVLPAGDTSVEATVIAVANNTADGPRTVEVSGELGARDIGRTFITILDDETTSANTPATGQPTIGGTPRIGRVLTASVSAILDADGLPSSFDYQWVRVDATDSETVVGSNRTYMPTFYDLGSTFRVKVRFIDAAGNAEGPLASAPTAAVMGVSCAANAVWCTTLTIGDGGDPPPPGGYCGPGTGTPNCDYGSLVDDRFTLDGTDYTVESVRWGSSNFHFTLDRDFPSARLGSLTLLISTHSLDLSDADDRNLNSGAVTNNYLWSASGDVGRFSSLPVGTSITVQLLAGAANTGATGRPEIEGTAQVGQELTAGMGDIADADGLPSSFAYQWVRVDSRGRETSVGANSSTYAVLSADVGSTIRVEVSFTDGAGNEEGPLASDPTATVVEADRTLTLTVSPSSVSEDAGATEVEVTGTLDGAPLTSAAQVAVTVGASDDTATEGTDYATVDELSLTIEAGETSGKTMFTLTPTDDAVDEDDEETLSVTGTTTASRVGEVVPTAVTISDNETEGQGTGRGVTVSAMEVSVTEGSNASYTVVLRTEPTADVTVSPSLSTGSSPEVSVSPATLTFTPGNWATAQAVTVKADHDDDAEDDKATIENEVSGGDYGSNGVTAPDVAVTVDDDDEPGLDLSKTSLGPAEGASESYTVALETQPTAEVTVTITGHAGTDLTLDKTSLTFTTTNWAAAQTVTVTAGQDDDAEDDKVTLTHTASGGGYTSVTEDLPVTVDDTYTEPVVINGAALVLSTASLGLMEGRSANYRVALATQPTAQVSVTITGHAGTDLTLDEANLTFTTTNWATGQTVRVTAGQDDDTADDEETLKHTASGGGYSSVTESVAKDLDVTVTDDDEPGLDLSKSSLGPAEGASESYRVALETQPTAQVTVTITGHSGTDLTLDKTSLTFTTTNWAAAQTVTVTAGQDDDAEDDKVTLTHTASGGGYGSVAEDLDVTVDDDDEPGLDLSKTSLGPAEGASESYTVALETQPTAEVTVTITGHAGTDLTLDKTSLTFTTTNWAAAQTVTVTAGQDDDAEDDKVTLTHTASGGGYTSVTEDLPVTVDDTYTEPVVINGAALVLSTASLGLMEGRSANYRVALATQPTAQVSVTITGHAGTDLTLDEANLTFTTTNWATGQTVRVTAGQDDDTADDEETLKHTASGGGYSSVTESVAKDLDVTVTDDDEPGLDLSKSSLGPAEGASESYRVALETQPTAQVTVTITGHSGTDLTLDKTSLTFTTTNWATGQTVTVTAGQDDDAEDDKVTLTHTASGGGYGSVAEDLDVTVDDDDEPGLDLSKTSLGPAEGGSESYTVALETQPTAQVTVTITGHSGTDLTLDKTSLTFTTTNWATGQTVTVTAGQDDDAEDDKVTLTHTASGGGYGSVAEDLDVTVADDDESDLAVVTVHALATSVSVEGPAPFELRRSGGDMGLLKVSYRHDESSDGNYVKSWSYFRPGVMQIKADYHVGPSPGTVTARVTGPSDPLCPENAHPSTSCTDDYVVGDPWSASMQVTANASSSDAADDALEDALTLVDGLTPDVAAAVLLGEQTLGEAELAALDRLGNGNGRYDVGDLLSWIDRCRRGKAHCGRTSTDSGPAAAALLGGAAAGGRSTPRRPGRRDSGRRGRASTGGIRSRARKAGQVLAVLLAATTAWSCTEGGLVGPPAYVPDPGLLTVEWSGPAAHRDVGVLLEFEGPAIDAVRAPGFELYESSAPGPQRIVVAGSLRPGPFVQFRVPDRGQFALYRVRVLQVTGEDYGLRDPTEYRAVVVMN